MDLSNHASRSEESRNMSDPYDIVPAGVSIALQPGLRRILAPNPSPMTCRGTNTYLLGTTDLAVIDPGPDDPAHLAAILDAVEPGQRIGHILVTHPHRDHSALAARLASVAGAPVLAFGTATDGRSPAMTALAASTRIGGGEGLDTGFAPHRRLRDGDTVAGDGWRIEALWTPGHMSSHLCLAWRDVLFSGDLVMGWSTTLISPPDGDLTQFLTSVTRLAGRKDRRFLPGHGPAVDTPQDRCRDLIAHRQSRTDQVRAALTDRPQTLSALTAQVYAGLDPALHPAASRNLFAHLVALAADGELVALPALAPDAGFARQPHQADP
jgi:glyoxylase-like metal-dependent hydrolase (beta-lactamase superfamily II)